MKFLKIKENVCINRDNIEALEVIDQLHTRIYMQNGGVYDAMYPYDTLVSLLNIEEKESIINNQEVLKNLNAMAKTASYFAG